MFKKIFNESIYEIVHNKKLIQIAFWMGLMHNIFLFGDFIYYINNTLYYKYHLVEKGSLQIVNEIVNYVIGNGYSLPLFIFAIIFFIGYLILYPLGTALMAFLLEKKEVQFGKAFSNYFTVVVVSAGLSLFTLSGWHIMNFFRIWIMDISHNILIQIIVIIFVIILTVATILTPFVIFSALLNKSESNKPEVRFRNALSHSASLAGGNLGITLKFIFLQILLFLRIFVNLLITVGIPIGIGYGLYNLGLFEVETIFWIAGILSFLLFIFILYVEAMINAFFFTFRYKLYKVLIGRNSDE